jgi:hypothetical protein
MADDIQIKYHSKPTIARMLKVPEENSPSFIPLENMNGKKKQKENEWVKGVMV